MWNYVNPLVNNIFFKIQFNAVIINMCVFVRKKQHTAKIFHYEREKLNITMHLYRKFFLFFCFQEDSLMNMIGP